MTTPNGDEERPGEREAETWGEYEWSEPSETAVPAATDPEPPAAPDPESLTATHPPAEPLTANDPPPAPSLAPPPRPMPPAPPELATGAPRVYRGELTSALGAVALLALMFATKWYGVAGVPDPSAARPAISTAENAWDGLTVVRWVMLVCILAVVGSVVLHASQRSHGTRTDTSLVILGLGGLTFALLFYRVLLVLPQADRVIDQKLGAVLGLVCALAITLGGVESVHEQRRFQRDLARRPRRRRAARSAGERRWSPTADRDRVPRASSAPDGPGGTGPATP